MAAVQHPLYSDSGMWNTGDSSHAYPATGHEQMASGMAYQYPLPPSLEAPPHMIPSFHLPQDLGSPHSPSLGKPGSPAIKDRGLAAVSKSNKIKRSSSTPNVRGQASVDAAAAALSAEKRRNKLGYHRTSVACGHCRRRKIRCIPALNDAQNRCSNCIRLKKECIFFPVDQQPQPEPKRHGSKGQSVTDKTSQSSSPAQIPGQLPSQLGDLPSSLPYSSGMPVSFDTLVSQSKRQRTESFSPDSNKATLPSRNFDFAQTPNAWNSSDASPRTKPQTEIPQAYWRVQPQESPLTPAFSPYTPTVQGPQHSWSAGPDHSPREEQTWSIPQRSISYSNLEGLQGHHQYSSFPQPSFGQNPGDNYTTKPRMMQTGMYPPPISTAGPNSALTSASGHDVPHSHPGGVGPQGGFAWQQPFAYQKPPTSAGEAYGPWGAGHGGQPPIPEEVNPGGAPYGYSEPPNAMYYPSHQQSGR